MADRCRFGCVPFSEGSSDGQRFYVRAFDAREALKIASDEARNPGFAQVFIKDDKGKMIHNGDIISADALQDRG